MDLNLFKLCAGLRVLGYLMILLVAAIIAVSYYAVVVVTWGPQLLRGGATSALAFSIVIVFHILLVMLLWSYFRVVFKDPGAVPGNWGAESSEECLEADSSSNVMECGAPEGMASSAPTSSSMDRRPAVRYCNVCQNGKPPRCHHCSVCQRCVLKMDHHCIWVVNCVGACNYKFFLLFLLYTFLETAISTVVLLPNFVGFFYKAKNHSSSPGTLSAIFLAFGKVASYFSYFSFRHDGSVFSLFPCFLQIVYLNAVLNLAFALSLLCFLVMHASLLSSNTTSVEVHEKIRGLRWKYDLGRKNNFEQVFGTNKALWFFPFFSKDDLNKIPALHGLDFPTRSEVEV